MIVKVEELRGIADRLFEHLEQSGVKEVDIDQDYYWIVPEEQRYDPREQPKELVLGQLSDDWKELRDVLRGEPPIAYRLVWFASVLRAVGEKSFGSIAPLTAGTLTLV